MEAHKAIQELLDTVKTIAVRKDDHKWKISKFHELLHIVWYMECFGTLRGLDADMGKKNHQELAKQPVSSCQQHYENFEQEVAS